jgi:hypothetical protein
MTKPLGHEITELLQAWRQGDEHALAQSLSIRFGSKWGRNAGALASSIARKGLLAATPEKSASGKFRTPFENFPV